MSTASEPPERSASRASAAAPPRDLGRVRSELQRLGYLSHGVERLLLQDALKARPPLSTLLLLALKIGLLVGAGLAFALALGLAAANGNLRETPLDLVPLFFHLLVPTALAAGFAFLALCGALVLLIEVAHVRRIEAWCFATALAGGGFATFALWRSRDLVAEFEHWQLALVAAGTAVAVVLLVRVAYHGLLTLAIRLTDLTPEGRLFSHRRLVLWLLFAALVVTLPLALSARSGDPVAEAPTSLPVAPGDRVLLVGIDGVLAEELDYLLAGGELPALGALAAEGAVVPYRREVQEPAAFWVTVATGRAPADHGVVAVDTFRPLGVRTPLASNGPVRSWWERVGEPLGLVEHRPLVSSRRQAFAVWELASRGGAPVAVVNWWSTFPAESLPGTVVAHGAWELLLAGSSGAVEPDTAVPRFAALAREAAEEPPPTVLDRAFGAEAAAALDHRALAADRFHRRVFAELLAGPGVDRAAALYLPGLDLAADDWSAGSLAFADLVRSELRAADALLADAPLAGLPPSAEGGIAPGVTFDTVVVVVDPGRRVDPPPVGEMVEGRVILWRRGGCPGPPPELLDSRRVASGLLRALGLPQSDELPPPPEPCTWNEPPSRVAGFGRRRAPETAPGEEEYLETLRSLGYL